MWQVPSLLKTVSTWDHVLSKLQGGADLMTPGLTHWNREIKAGQVVAVTLQNRVPMAVGVAAFDVGNLSKAVGEKGKAVYIVHCFKDELWTLGKKTQPPATMPSTTEELEESTQHLTLESEEEDVDNNQVETPDEPAPESSKESVPEPSGTAEHSVSGTTDDYTSNNLEIDNAFKSAAIYGLYEIKSTNSGNTISFPLTSSTFVSTHLMSYLPEPYAEYTFKKTSWKKAATFLKKYMDKEGLIKTKDRSGEPVIQSINWNHKLITEFQPYPLEQKKVEKTGAKDAGASGPSTPVVQVRDLYKATGKVLRSIVESQRKSYLSCSEVLI
jgi:translation initiation factor 2D